MDGRSLLDVLVFGTQLGLLEVECRALNSLTCTDNIAAIVVFALMFVTFVCTMGHKIDGYQKDVQAEPLLHFQKYSSLFSYSVSACTPSTSLGGGNRLWKPQFLFLTN